MKHAPRGPVKERADLMNVDDPNNVTALNGNPVRCTATSKATKDRCKNPAMAGGYVCRNHGGKAPQVMAAAQFRVMDAYRAMQPTVVNVLGQLLVRDEYPTVQIAAVREVMDRTEGKPRETVAHTGAEGGPMEIVIRKPWALPEKA